MFSSLGEDAPEPEDALCPELSMEELKAAFRYSEFHLESLTKDFSGSLMILVMGSSVEPG